VGFFFSGLNFLCMTALCFFGLKKSVQECPTLSYTLVRREE
jgi:hypothetical protein